MKASQLIITNYFQGFHSRVVFYCEDVNTESRNTLTVCYKIQETLNPNSEECEELIILCDVVNMLKTRTNAAGFYYIDRSIIGRVVSYLFSYTIVLIQFNRQYNAKSSAYANRTFEFK